jgi:hypothetical protein
MAHRTSHNVSAKAVAVRVSTASATVAVGEESHYVTLAYGTARKLPLMYWRKTAFTVLKVECYKTMSISVSIQRFQDVHWV